MPEEYGGLDLVVPEGTDSPDVPKAFKDFSDSLTPGLLDLPLGQLESQTAGKLLIANASGVITGTAMSGDVTISDSGVTEIGAGKVGTTELAELAVTTGKVNNKAITLGKLAEALGLTEGYYADASVTSRKAKLTAGVKAATEDLTLSGAYQDVVGASLTITPTVNSVLVITAVFVALQATEEGTEGIEGTINLDPSAVITPVALIPRITGNGGSAVQVYEQALTAAEEKTVKLRAKRSGGTTGKLAKEKTRFKYELYAA